MPCSVQDTRSFTASRPQLFICFRHFQLANRYKIMSCLIQKSMSTLLQSSMCYLHSERRFLGAGRVLNQESYSKRFCEWKNELNLQSNGLQVLNRTGLRLTDQWIYLAIVRDPVDRFLSAFTDKCIRCDLL